MGSATAADIGLNRDVAHRQVDLERRAEVEVMEGDPVVLQRVENRGIGPAPLLLEVQLERVDVAPEVDPLLLLQVVEQVVVHGDVALRGGVAPAELERDEVHERQDELPSEEGAARSISGPGLVPAVVTDAASETRARPGDGGYHEQQWQTLHTGASFSDCAEQDRSPERSRQRRSLTSGRSDASLRL